MRIIGRKARVEDLKAINDLTDAMHHYLAGLYGLKLSAGELEEEHYDEDELEDTYVAEEVEGGVIGCMSFSLGRNEWAGPNYGLQHIIIQEDYGGLGVAGRLFEVLLEKAKRERMNITTGTLARNKRALKFYGKLGFKQLSVGLLLDLRKRILDK